MQRPLLLIGELFIKDGRTKEVWPNTCVMDIFNEYKESEEEGWKLGIYSHQTTSTNHGAEICNHQHQQRRRRPVGR